MTGMRPKRRCWWTECFTASRARCCCRVPATAIFSCSIEPTARAYSPFLLGRLNWSLGVDKQGRPIPNPAKEPAPDGRLIAPDESGMTNYRSPSFDPKTGLFIVSAHPSYSIYFAKPADGTYGWAGADYGLWGKGVIEAIDYQTGKIRWTHESGTRNSRCGSPDHGLRAHLHRRCQRQFSCS